jgi:dipeptidyl-peptidase-4
MIFPRLLRSNGTLLLLLAFTLPLQAQFDDRVQWLPDGQSYTKIQNGAIVKIDGKNPASVTPILSLQQLTPPGEAKYLRVRRYTISDDGQRVLLNTNTQRVWRFDTRGDYWVADLKAGTLRQLGKDRPAASLQFAKFSPDGSKVAYVSEHNLFVEDLASGNITPLTTDGTDRLINGTFDWAYEEEFFCRDGFRWAPDGRSLAYWQIDARKIRDFLMINNTDSTYAFTVPVEYPKAGEPPSPARIGIVSATGGRTTWLQLPGDPAQHYLPRMEWAGADEVILQQLNRMQNQSIVFLANAKTGAARPILTETDEAWIDVKGAWNDGDVTGWDWLNGGKEFLWVSERDGWRHLYRVSRDGKTQTLLTPGNYDVITTKLVDERGGYVYVTASPANATQAYLHRVKLTGPNPAFSERLTPSQQPGTHTYDISPTAQLAVHRYSSANVPPQEETITLPDHNGPVSRGAMMNASRNARVAVRDSVEFFKIKTADGVEMDGYLVKPRNFDPAKRYPVVFEVYTEPAAQTVVDRYGTGRNFLYAGSMAADGYLYVAFDNRGTPAPKGRVWRKSIYQKIGQLNIRDQALGLKEFLKRPYVDSSRVAVWGWSGGGAATLNLLFQYPELYQTGIAVAAISDQRLYDNIYQERYMGLPQENPQAYAQASPLSYAKNLRGNLLYIHGTGDDNVHYQNAERLINELVRHNRQFQLMSYPNRSHGMSEGEGTFRHLQTLYTQYLKQHCPPGGR